MADARLLIVQLAGVGLFFSVELSVPAGWQTLETDLGGAGRPVYSSHDWGALPVHSAAVVAGQALATFQPHSG